MQRISQDCENFEKFQMKILDHKKTENAVEPHSSNSPNSDRKLNSGQVFDPRKTTNVVCQRFQEKWLHSTIVGNTQ